MEAVLITELPVQNSAQLYFFADKYTNYYCARRAFLIMIISNESIQPSSQRSHAL